MTKALQTKPVSAQFGRDLDEYIQKSFDISGGDKVPNELWATETKAFMDAATLKSLFFTEDWVYAVVDLIANKISSQPLRVYQQQTDANGVVSYDEVPEHPLNALFEQPNEWQDYGQWMYNTVVELFLMGNAIIWNAPRSGQLMTLPTETVSLDFDARGGVVSYSVYEISELLGQRDLMKTQAFDTKQIAHIRRPNPSSLLWGLSPFIPGRRSILFNRYSTDYLNAFYLKQATPGLALSLDRNVNEDVALRQLRSFEVAYQGRKNQRRTLILPKGVTATPLTHTLSDQKLLDHINQNRETILALFKVPKHEVGLQTSGSLGSEEYKVALRNFWEACLIPGMRIIEGTLTKFFQAQLGEDHFLQFDIAGVEALRDDMQKKADIAAKMLQAGLSLNEVRQEVWKQEPSDDPLADVPFILAQKQSAPQFPPAAGQTPPPPAQEPPPPPPEGKALTNKLTFTPELERFRAHITKQLVDEEQRTLGELAQAAVKLLVDMTGTALETYAKLVKSWGPVITKAKDSATKRALQRAIQRALNEQFEEDWKNEVARTLSTSVELGYDQQLQIIFNEKARQEVEVLRARDEEKRRLTLAARGLDSFENISKTHTERIMKAITDGQDRGESVSTIMRSVAKLLGTPGELAGKAETIARTETLTAVSIGQAAAMANAKEVIPGLKKAWLTAGDNRVRDSHAALNGDVVDVDEAFGNGLNYPRDVESGDAAETINCRCTLIMLPPGETLP